MELVKLLPVYSYSVDILSHSGPPVMLGSEGKQNTTKVGARGRIRIIDKFILMGQKKTQMLVVLLYQATVVICYVYLTIQSHEQTQ